MTDTDDDLAARLRPTLTGYYDAPGPTDVVRVVEGHPGGAMALMNDCVEAARRWVTSRPVSAACPLSSSQSVPPPA